MGEFMDRLWYRGWAKNWNEALPIGNGRIGGMVFCDPDCDKIVLNEETLWSGSPENEGITHNMKDIEHIRNFIKNKEFDKSEKAITDMLEGRSSQMYLTFGELNVSIDNFDSYNIIDYERELNLNTAIVSCKYKATNYERNGTLDYEREYFTSLADDVMVMKVKANNPWIVSSVSLDCWLDSKCEYIKDLIKVAGRAPTSFNPDNMENNYEMSIDKESIPFCAKVKIITDGSVFGVGKTIKIWRASYFTIVYSIATGFNGYDKQPVSEGVDYEAICNKKLEDALKYTYEELKDRHISAYKEQYDRMELEIDGIDNDDIPTDVRIENVSRGIEDNKLTELLFKFGRYLLISSSQPGGQPTNLQGIWSKDLLQPWRCNYTININTQMNYWCAEQVNLSECHLPVINMVRELSTRGNHFGLRGWCCPHNTDIWRFNSEATKGVLWSCWYMGGLWLAREIYEHYAYTCDKKFLEDNIGVLEGIYDFLEDWLIRDDKGYLTTCPSTSPENVFLYNGIEAAAAHSSAMDLSLIADYLDYMIKLLPIVNRETFKYKKMLSELKPLSIGSDGRLLEYGEEFEETEPGHRHISHLVGVFPCNVIKNDTPLYEAAKKSLEFRLKNGGGHTGWSNAWIANVYARFKDGENANKHIINMFKKSIYPNMFDAHPPFQIDGNFGICSAICEMLMQSHDDKIELIPAIPKAWKSGRVKGMKARGGKTVSFSWQDGRITKEEIK